MSPIIGVTAYREQARWGVWNEQADVLHASYAQAIEAAGGIAVLLPPTADPARDAPYVVALLDGLIISGGADVSPSRYGRDVDPRTVGWRDDRDAWELALLDAAGALPLPVLGVCRGMQVMAVHAGGQLDQHTPDIIGHDDHSPGGDVFGQIGVATVNGTKLAAILGDAPTVRCHHHQSVAAHPGFVAAASAADGTLEAMEDPDRPFWMAVQWHPETQEDQGLFKALVTAAKIRLGSTGAQH